MGTGESIDHRSDEFDAQFSQKEVEQPLIGVIKLKASRAFSEGAPPTETVIYVSDGIERNPADVQDGGYCIPITYPGAWGGTGSEDPRSVYRREGVYWMQLKGTGNPDRPNYPPEISDYMDFGHRVFWAVNDSEAHATADGFANLSSTPGLVQDFRVANLMGALKFEEVPIPTDADGGYKVLPVKVAYKEEWEFDDEFRQRQILRMRRDLALVDRSGREDVANHYFDELVDDEIIERYFDRWGFYQLQIEQRFPFRNEINRFVDNPIILDYLRGAEGTSLESQAMAVRDAYRLFVRSVLRKDVELPMPEFTDLGTPLQVLSSEGLSEIDAKMAQERPFWHTREKAVTQESYDLLATRYGSDIVQLDGDRFIRRIASELPGEARAELLAWLNDEVKGIGVNVANAIATGIALRDSAGRKDSSGAQMSDYGYTGGHFIMDIDYAPDKRGNVTMESRAKKLARDMEKMEVAAMGSVYDICKFTGVGEEQARAALTLYTAYLVEALSRQKDLVKPPFISDAYMDTYRATLRWIKDDVQSKMEAADGEPKLDFYVKQGVPLALAMALMSLNID